jgi:hypothetical protein
MRITKSARRHGVSDEAIRHAVTNAIRLIDTDDGVFAIGADAAGRMLELARPVNRGRGPGGVSRHASSTGQRQQVPDMTTPHTEPDKAAATLAERLAPMTIAEIDAMSDKAVAALMGATAEEIAAEPAWTWREAAKAATDEYADRGAGEVEAGRAELIDDPGEARRRLGGRPRVGGVPGDGPSMQVRVRVTTRTRTALEAIAEAQGRRLAEVSREALDEYVARHDPRA